MLRGTDASACCGHSCDAVGSGVLVRDPFMDAGAVDLRASLAAGCPRESQEAGADEQEVLHHGGVVVVVVDVVVVVAAVQRCPTGCGGACAEPLLRQAGHLQMVSGPTWQRR